MEIKVGDFIRTTDGYIRKIDNINTDKNIITRRGKYILDMSYKNSQSVAESKIVKHSQNIIDIIECGDYVNGSKVIDIAQASVRAVYTEDATQKMALIPKINEDIKSVVTKEQFNQMKYIVGDE